MYTDEDIEGTVTAGDIDREAAKRLKMAASTRRDDTLADDERFRLVTGFNDVFVTIASGLVLYACWTLSGPAGGLVVAAASWGLAEHFTRRKHMALPSIFLLVTYSGGTFSFLAHLNARANGAAAMAGSHSDGMGVMLLVGMTAAGCLTAAAVLAHWRRFHVPITVAAGALALAYTAASVTGIMLAIAGVDWITALSMLRWFALAVGVAMFAYAMHWDRQDPERLTRRADVAFWLHLAASPLIVHPLFSEIAGLSMGRDGATLAPALMASALYAALGVLALAIDRRAVLVSALAYAVVAIAVITQGGGQAGTGLAISCALIGGLLLAMSVFWHGLRRGVLSLLPEGLRRTLPPTAGPNDRLTS